MTTNPKMHEAHEDLNFTVSPVIGDGAEAHRIARVGDWTLTLPGADGTKAEIPDTELARRLGLDLDKLRELSGRHERAGHIEPRRFSPTVGDIPRGRGRPGVQRFYSEEDALFLVTCSETPKAVALKKEMIRVYTAVRHGLLPRPANDTQDMLAIARELAALRVSVASLQNVLAVNASGPVMGYGVARSNVLIPLRRVAARLAFADPVRRYRQWLACLHKELRRRLGRGMSTPYGLMPTAALPETLAFIREREAEATLREKMGASNAQGTLLAPKPDRSN